MLYRLEPMLRTRRRVRAAVAASLVKSCGEISFDYCARSSDNDDRPLAALIEPLASCRRPSRPI